MGAMLAKERCKVPRTIAATVPILLAMLLLNGCDGLIRPAGSLEPDGLEYQYILLAAALPKPELCHKISPRSVSVGALENGGRQVAYLRSRCYLEVALQLRQSSYCERVKPAESWLYASDFLTPESCRRQVRALRLEQRPRLAVTPNFGLIVAAMGYGPDHLDAIPDVVGKSRAQTLLTFLERKRPEELERRLRQLPDFSRKKF
jgi:hypothetical protein